MKRREFITLLSGAARLLGRLPHARSIRRTRFPLLAFSGMQAAPRRKTFI